MSKSFKQLEKYYYESIQSAENYGFNYKTDKDFIRFNAEIKKGEKKSNIAAANNAYDNFIESKNKFIQKVKTDEQRLKRQGKWAAKTPTAEEEEEEGDLPLSEGQPSKEEEEEEEMQVIPSEDI